MPSFTLKEFQRQDLIRATMTDGCILAWDPGLGKSIAAFSLCLLKLGWNITPGGTIQIRGAALIVAPGGLHDQLAETAREPFGQTVTRLDKATFRRLVHYDPDLRRWVLPPGFYITSYTQLGRNGARPIPDWDGMAPPERWTSLGVTDAEADALRLRSAFSARDVPWASLDPEAQAQWRDEVANSLAKTFRSGLSDDPGVEDPYRLRCVWDTTLSDECRDTFDCVVVDEGTRLKGDSFIAAGVLRLRPRSRYVLTATPIKNRLPDFFALAWWACGGHPHATARFPYRPDDREDFADRFCQRMTKINPATGKRAKGGWSKLTPQVCEVHALWKLAAGVMIRRRKQDAGVSIPPKHRRLIRVSMTPHERTSYKKLLDRDTDPGTKLSSLREFSGLVAGKLRVALSLILQIMRQGDQVILFSSFNAPLRLLSEQLSGAGADHLLMTHETGEKKRAALAARFAAGPAPGGVPVMLAGTACMSEGYNFPRCVHVVHLDYSLSADHMVQADNRVHRLTSTREVSSWRIIVDGTIDRALEALDGEKQDAAELVLDASLLSQQSEETTAAKILMAAAAELDGTSQGDAHIAEDNTDSASLLRRIAAIAPTWPSASPCQEPNRHSDLDPEAEAMALLLALPD